MILSILFVLGMLLSGCQSVSDTKAGEDGTQTTTSPALTQVTDESGNPVTTVADVEGDVIKGNTRSADATATTTQKAGTMQIKVGDKTFQVKLEENDTAQALKTQLPLTLTMSELNGNEKYYYYSALPSNPTRVGTIHAGDIMLYQGNYLVIFYKTFESEYSYTRIGSITNTSGLAKALGSGSVTVEWSIS